MEKVIDVEMDNGSYKVKKEKNFRTNYVWSTLLFIGLLIYAAIALFSSKISFNVQLAAIMFVGVVMLECIANLVVWLINR
jgi:small basic protein